MVLERGKFYYKRVLSGSFGKFYDVSWRRKRQPTPVLLPGKSNGWRSLVGYSPWGCKEWDKTEPRDFPGGPSSKASVYNARDLGLIPGLGRSPGEENGNPLQDYCLEHPMDGGAW